MGSLREHARILARRVVANRQRVAGQQGATTVEFAFAMIFLSFFFIAYVEITEIFLAHERVTYAAFKASRAHQVHGNAYLAASAVDSNFTLDTGQDSVTVSKEIPVPIDFENPFTKNAIREQGTTFRVAAKVPTFVEPRITSGDN